MSDLEDLVARLKLDISDFEKNAKKAEGATDDLAKKTEEAATKNDKWGESFDRVMNAFTGINQGIQLVQQVLGGLKKAYDAVVTSTAEYAESIYHASNLAGVSTEQMSRLVQAADDFRVSQETLTGAMGMALKNGFVPSIENIAALSDELLAIKDPAERAGRATEIFGRQWEDVMPLLLQGGDAIREATGGISDNLVVTEEAAKQAMDYAAQVDALTDAWTGLKMNAGEAVLPIIIKILQVVDDAITPDEDTGPQVHTESMNARARALKDEAKQNLQIMRQFFRMSETEYYDALLHFEDGTMGVMEEIDYANSIIDRYNTTVAAASKEMDDWATANYEFGYSYESVVAAAEVGVKAVDDVTAAYEKQRDVLENELIQANMKLNVEISTFRQSVASQLVQGLKDAGLEGDELVKRLKLLDDYAGTDYVLQYKMEMEIDGLLKTLIEDPEAFSASVQAFDDAFLPLQTSIIAAQDEADILQGQLDAMEREYLAIVRIVTVTGRTLPYSHYTDSFNPNAPGQDEGEDPHGTAGGGSVFPGQTVKWGEYGPETFVASASGRILSRADSMNAVGQAEQGSGYDSDLLQALANIPTAKDFARAVRDAILLAGG